MKHNVFQPYTDIINEALKTGRQRGQLTKSFNDTLNESKTARIAGSRNHLQYSNEKDKELFASLSSLGILSGVNAKPHQALGAHPDFAYLKNTGGTEEHYIVSMFIDIKNSTGLFKKYYPETVAFVTTTIQRLAIHVCWYFGGYVQRLHGDGLLAYFGGKNISIQQACENAINAASVFSYYMKNDLKNTFDLQGVSNITTRIGVDVGPTEDVLWHPAGISECSEVTTCSLHTSLAYKMQSSAALNGIIVGDNIKIHLPSLADSLFSHKKYKTDSGEEEYIYEIPDENFRYKQWAFNWFDHLKQLKNVIEQDGHLYFNPSDQIHTQTSVTTEPIRDISALEKIAVKNVPWTN